MATHKIGNNGKYEQVAKFDKSLMLTLKDIFPDDPIMAKDLIKTKPNVPKGKLQVFYKVKDNSSLIRKIFRLYLKEVLYDVVSGNCLYQFPGNSQAEIFISDLKDSVVRDKRKRGHLQEFDLISTNYKIPRLKYRFSRTSKRQQLEIYVNKEYYSKLVEVANEGKVFSKRPKNITHFIHTIYEQFPYITEKSINRIIRVGSQRVSYNLRRGEELSIVDREGEIRFYRPLGRIHDKVMRSVRRRSITRENNKNESRTVS